MNIDTLLNDCRNSGVTVNITTTDKGFRVTSNKGNVTKTYNGTNLNLGIGATSTACIEGSKLCH